MRSPAEVDRTIASTAVRLGGAGQLGLVAGSAAVGRLLLAGAPCLLGGRAGCRLVDRQRDDANPGCSRDRRDPHARALSSISVTLSPYGGSVRIPAQAPIWAPATLVRSGSKRRKSLPCTPFATPSQPPRLQRPSSRLRSWPMRRGIRKALGRTRSTRARKHGRCRRGRTAHGRWHRSRERRSPGSSFRTRDLPPSPVSGPRDVRQLEAAGVRAPQRPACAWNLRRAD